MQEDQLSNFRKYLDKRRLDPGTVALYCSNVRLALQHSEGPLGRLADPTLAPKTLRHILAALRAWAKFTGDVELTQQLGKDELRLPPANRLNAKTPIDRDDWIHLVAVIKESKLITDPMRCVLAIMAIRGFRVGDSLRMRRTEVVEALKNDVLSYIAKGNRRLEFGIGSYQWCLELLLIQKDWVQVFDLISPGAQRSRRQKSAALAVRRALHIVAEEAGLDPKEIHPHKLRRTVAVNFLEKIGGDIVKLTSWMGWQNVTTAAGYVDHNRRKELDKIGDALLED